MRAQFSPASQYFPLFFPARCAPWASASLPLSFKHLGLQACACKVLVTVGYLLIAPFSQCLFKGMRNRSSPVRCPAGSRVHLNGNLTFFIWNCFWQNNASVAWLSSSQCKSEGGVWSLWGLSSWAQAGHCACSLCLFWEFCYLVTQFLLWVVRQVARAN